MESKRAGFTGCIHSLCVSAHEQLIFFASGNQLAVIKIENLENIFDESLDLETFCLKTVLSPTIYNIDSLNMIGDQELIVTSCYQIFHR